MHAPPDPRWPAGPAIVRLPDAASYPLAPAQERLWLLDRMDSGDPTWNVASALRLAGRMDTAALGRAFELLLARHAALRTRFSDERGTLRQVVDPRLPAGEPSGLAATALTLSELAQHRFDLASAPLLRGSLVPVGDDERVLVLVAHRSVCDGQSLALLERDLGTLYSCQARGVEPDLPALPLRYVDFVAWQRTRLEGRRGARLADYWRRRLYGVPPATGLPADRRRPPVKAFACATVRHTLDAPLTAALRRLGEVLGVTALPVFLAALQALMARLTGEDDVCVGVPTSGRPRDELDGVVGPFASHLPFRGDLAGDSGFAELVVRTRDRLARDRCYRELPFELLLRLLRPAGDSSSWPLFQVCLEVIDSPAALPHFHDLAASRHPVATERMPFDLALRVRATEGAAFALELVHDSALYSRTRMEEMLGQLELLLRAMVADLASGPSRPSLVTRGARTALPDPAARLDATWRGPVTALFAERCREAPDRTAVETRRERLSYGRLGDLVDRLGRHLLASGVGGGDVVAILGERRPELVWAVLGVLHAGAAFVVLDPASPADALARQVQLVSPAAYVALSPRSAGGPEAAVEEAGCRLRVELPPWRGADAHPFRRYEGRPPDRAPDDVAYVAFTSGSAHAAKGIAGRLGPLSEFQPWLRSEFGIGPDDRFSLLSGLAHDSLHRDLFAALVLGGTICCPEPRDIASGRLAQYLRDLRVTVANLTPGTVRLVLRDAGAVGGRIETLRTVFVAGDRLHAHGAARLQAAAPRARIVNYYGTTETERAAAYYVVGAAAAEPFEVLPIGRGVPGTQLLVVNAAGRQAGIGEVGRIHLRSPHLAQGYVGDVEGTRERFTSGPLGDDPVYRTGDVGRYLPDGSVRFLGRLVEDMRVGGFRVDPGEVAGALLRHPDVDWATVLPESREHPWTACVGSPRADLTGRELRRFLRATLPDHMVPARFVRLDRMPLTANGKLDRQRLAEIARAPRPAPDPLDGVESALAEIWRGSLGADDVGPDADLFELAGGSLPALRMLARLDAAFGVRLAPRQFLRCPQLRDQADLVRAARRGPLGASWHELPETGDNRGPL